MKCKYCGGEDIYTWDKEQYCYECHMLQTKFGERAWTLFLSFIFFWTKNNRDWWKYVLSKNNRTLKSIICRIRNHPCGVTWFSYGNEPDMHCKNCGDDLG